MMSGGTRKQISLSPTQSGKKQKLVNMLANTSMELNMEDVISYRLEKQQNVLNSVVHKAVKWALFEINN